MADEQESFDVWALPETYGLNARSAIHTYLKYLRRVLSREELMYLMHTKAREVREKGLESEQESFTLRSQCADERAQVQSRILALGDAIDEYATTCDNRDSVRYWLEWMIQEVIEWRKNATSRDGLGTFSDFSLDFEDPTELWNHKERVNSIDQYWKDNDGWLLSYRFIFKTSELRQSLIVRVENIIDSLSQTAVATRRQSQDRLKWNSSISAFAFIFKELAKKGYYELPSMQGKGGDANNTEWARRILQAFDIHKDNGDLITAENLRQRLSDSEPNPLASSKQGKFSIPDKSDLD